jgi:hypothetical protein
MRHSLWITAVLILIGCSSSAPPPAPVNLAGGGTVGNGGDPVGVLFAQGRAHAIGVVQSFSLEVFKRISGGRLSPSQIAWLDANRALIVEDLENTPYHWVSDGEISCQLETCGCTTSLPKGEVPRSPLPKRPVHFSRSLCTERIRTKHEAGLLILHESLHHLQGPSDDDADRFAAAIYDTWGYMGNPEAPHWTRSPGNLPNRVWNGREMVSWSHRLVEFEDLATSKVRQLTTHNALPFSSERWSSPEHPNPETGVWAADRLFVFQDCLRQSDPVPAYLLDANTETWVPVSSKHAPTDRGHAQLMASQERVVVWGGNHCELENAKEFEVRGGYWKPIPVYAWKNDGAAYNLRTAEWESIPPPPGADSKVSAHRFRSAVAADQLLSWGAGGGLGNRLLTGFVYDLKQRRWTETSPHGAPVAQFDPVTISTGENIIVMCGLRSDQGCAEEGGIYSPATNTWTRFSVPEELRRGPRMIHGVWSGTELVLIGSEKLAFYRPDADRWQTYRHMANPELDLFTQLFSTGFKISVRTGNAAYFLYP